MKLVGRTDIGSVVVELPANQKRVARFKLAQDGRLAKGTVFMDGLGAGQGVLTPQACRMVLYTANDALIVRSDEVLIRPGLPPQWVDFRFRDTRGALELAHGDLFVGVHAGGGTNVARIYTDTPRGMGSKYNTDTYSDGSSSTFGAATASTADISCFVSYFSPYSDVRPLNETDLYYSRLPFAEAQAVFSLGGPEAGTARVIDVGWHDTFIDPESGSNAMVREGGPLEGLLGERIRVSATGVAQPRSVYAYVHNLADPSVISWDLSLTRHLFAQLGPLAADTIPSVVEVIL